MSSRLFSIGILISCLGLGSYCATAREPVVVRVQTNSPGVPPHSILLRSFLTAANGETFAIGRTFSDALGPTNIGPGDLAVAKFAANGDVLWTAQYDGHGLNDNPFLMATDAAGNFYVTGMSGVEEYVAEGVTLKYTGTGVPVWTNRVRAEGFGLPVSLSVDGGGNVAVIYRNYYYNSTGNLLVKLNADGTLGWQKDLGRPGDLSTANSGVGAWYLSSFDGAGNVVITGPSDLTNGPPDVLTTKFDPNGGHLWTRGYSARFDEGTGVVPDAITIDRFGNIFIATFTGKSSPCCVVPFENVERRTILSFTPSGELRWTNAVPDYSSGMYPAELALPMLATDKQGAVYFAFVHRTAPAYEGNMTVAKFGRHGRRQWEKKLANVGDAFDHFNFARFGPVTPRRVTLYQDAIHSVEEDDDDEIIRSPGVWTRTELQIVERP